VEIMVARETGPAIPVNVSTSALREPNGEVIGALAVFSDLSEIKQLEAEVRRAERLATVGTLAAGMAHEIKNPLVSLKTFAQLLPTKYNDPDFRGYFSQIASQEIERINSLVEQLLRFARPSRPLFMPLDVHDPIEQTLLLVANELGKGEIEVEKYFWHGSLFVFADAEQLKQVLLNLLLNAIDATRDAARPRLTISTGHRKGRGREGYRFPKLPDGYVLTNQEAIIRISDNGHGIQEKDQRHIFDPFFTTKEQGHGLGLSIAHGIVREHLGSVTVQSQPGSGTTFTLSFPLIHSVKQERIWEGMEHEVRADRFA
jgi:signal transduction histidine kinase